MGSVDKKLQVLLVGSGAIGTMVAYALEKGGKAEVAAVLRSNFEAVFDNGFTIQSVDHGKIKDWRPTSILDSIPSVNEESWRAPYDYVIVTTKNIPDIPPSLPDLIAPAITPGHTAIALIQNGLNIERPFFSVFPTNPVLSGITFMGAIESPPGTINHHNHDRTYIGVFRNPAATPNQKDIAIHAADDLVNAYRACGPNVDCTYEPNVPYSRWRKLLYNASYNGVAAILGIDTSRMRFSEHIIDDLIRPLMQEIRATAKAAAGVELEEELIETMITADGYDKFFKPSMLQDVEKGQFIEFENLVGEPLREAQRAGVATPTLKVVYGLLKGLQFKAMEGNMEEVVVPRSGEGLRYGGCGKS
ncbi:ketopantoate reductase PanE/ApbA-domain-containing protein [Pseudoneurospora amorphoporcata]|uniref:Ketopantoate reductase PanE/ApbA-domain-containing protein n=1 Tax=Pseudoneurospora amorphoporcata TaxID=241081 RepID=A0AAN6NPU5_9PEZI|nr:ketopantoate reductase PanE/ApbA-domain-containing protein [Pseudoneurospora amorphoporcata]